MRQNPFFFLCLPRLPVKAGAGTGNADSMLCLPGFVMQGVGVFKVRIRAVRAVRLAQL